MRWNVNDLFCHDLPSDPVPEIGKVLVTGGTGYIGGRLVPELLARGYNVRVMVLAASSEQQQRWPGAEIVEANGLDPEKLKKALEGVHTAYYLIHSMLIGQKEHEFSDLQAAENFSQVAENQQVQRIIYLGGLGDAGRTRGDRLKSRFKVAEIFSQCRIPATILRAAFIIGSGSASFEIISGLVKNIPFIMIPEWARNPCQPIGIRDVIRYLVGVMEVPQSTGQSYDIGGPDLLSFASMLRSMATLLNNKIIFIPWPGDQTRIFSYLAGIITPVPQPITGCILEGCKHHIVCRENAIQRLLPFQCIPFKEVLLRAATREDQDKIATRWSDAYPPAYELTLKLKEMKGALSYVSEYSLLTTKSADNLFRAICNIGGAAGWFHSNLLWHIRGWVDRILLGVGTVRGRRSKGSLRINDVIDFWRVEDLQPQQRLLLRAEMKLPGRGWLEFRIDPERSDNHLYVKAYFFTDSLLGRVYWYFFLPFHIFIFNDMIRQIEKNS